MAPEVDPFPRWYQALERRHLERLTFPELRRALQALSSAYVERRDEGAPARALESAGKRAAFALYYAPIHFLTVRSIVEALGAASPAPRRLLDLGCGTGAASAAWALGARPQPRIEGIDTNAWALEEARFTWRSLGLSGSTRRLHLLGSPAPGRDAGVVLGWVVNELDDAARAELLSRLLAASKAGTRVLVVEPIARRGAPWWPVWAGQFAAAGGQAREWRFPARLPERLGLLDRAAGLDHRELTARSLWL